MFRSEVRAAACAALVFFFVAVGGVAQTTTWTGNQSASWTDPLNWTAGVPHAGLNVVIPQSTSTDPETSGAGAITCLSLAMNGGTNLTVDAGDSIAVLGALAMGGDIDSDGAITVGGDLSGSGSMTGNGTFALVGGGNVVWSGATNFDVPFLFAKSSGSLVSLDGNVDVATFTMTGGTFAVSVQANKKLTVAGTATFAGGVLTVAEIGRLELLGDVVFSGTTCVAAPDVRAYANWTGSLGFAPTNGTTVTFNGTGVQSIFGVNHFASIRVATTSTTVVVGATSLEGPSIVDGVLDSTSGQLDVNSDIDVKLGGTWAIGTTAQRIGGSLTASGAITGAGSLVFDGVAAALWTGPVAFPGEVRVEKSGGGILTVGGNVGAGTFTLVSGTFAASDTNGHAMTVAGDANFNGGELTVANVGDINVLGDVVFAGTTCALSPNFVCYGDWTGHPAYAPSGAGDVTFAGTAPQTASGAVVFPNLIVAPGAVLVAGAPTAVNGDLTISGTLDAHAHAITVGGDTAVDGTWIVGSPTHALGGGLKGTGAITGGGQLDFVGAAAANFEGPPSIAATARVAKAAGGIVTLGGSLTASALVVATGTFLVADNANDVLTLTGDALFSGGVLGIANLGTLVVAGDVVFAGTACAVSPNIAVGGDWVGHPAYAPFAGGTVTFVPGGPHVLTGTMNFPGLTVPPTVSLAFPGPAHIALTLTLGGVLDSTAGSVDADGAVTIAAGGIWNCGALQNTVAGALTGAGAINGTGPLVLDGAVGFSWNCPTVYGGPILVAKTGGAPVVLAADIACAAFTLSSGAFTAGDASPRTLTAAGDVILASGTLSTSFAAGAAQGAIVALGDMSLLGVSCAATPHLTCGGDWISGASYAPTSGGVVTLNGVGPTTIDVSAPGAVLSPPSLVLVGGPKSALSDLVVRSSTVLVGPGSGLLLGAHRATFHRPTGATTVTVQGALKVGAGGGLRFGPSASCTIAPTGLLGLYGDATGRAFIDGDLVAGGGYALAIDGAVEGANFDVLRPGVGGFAIRSTATIGAFPLDLRSMTFDFPSTLPGARLLSIERTVPTELRYVTFRNTSAVPGAVNAASTGGAAVGITNWNGAFSGPAFESDPSGVIHWNPSDATSTSYFAATAGYDQATVQWSLATLNETVGIVVERSAGGPAVLVHETATAALGADLFVDAGLVPATTYTYALSARLTHGGLWPLATAVAATFDAPPPAGVLTVGTGGSFPTIQSAIDFAVNTAVAFPALRVRPGTYSAFAVTTIPLGGLRIVADGIGVFVDTTAGPASLATGGVPATVELVGLTFGLPGTPSDAATITGFTGVLLIDDCTFAAATGFDALRVQSSSGVAVQRSVVSGNLRVVGSGPIALADVSTDALTISAGSVVQTVGVVASATTIDGGSTREDYAGPPTDLSFARFTSLGTPLSAVVTGFPNAPFAIFASFGASYVAFPASFLQMPLLLDPVTLFPLIEGTSDGQGHGEFSAVIPGLPFLLGFQLQLQAVAIDPLTNDARLSNSGTVIAVL